MIAWIHKLLPLPFPFFICVNPYTSLSEALKLPDENKPLSKEEVEALKKKNKKKAKSSKKS